MSFLLLAFKRRWREILIFVQHKQALFLLQCHSTTKIEIDKKGYSSERCKHVAYWSVVVVVVVVVEDYGSDIFPFMPTAQRRRPIKERGSVRCYLPEKLNALAWAQNSTAKWMWVKVFHIRKYLPKLNYLSENVLSLFPLSLLLCCGFCCALPLFVYF
jgi:hypothetical protein